MEALVIPFPNIDPILFKIGPVAIRWYALSYIAGLMLGWRYVIRLAANQTYWPKKPPITKLEIDDLLFWAAMGTIIGGRLGYLAFYGIPENGDWYFEKPLRLINTLNGGMSFHGGLLGVVTAVILFTRRKSLSLFSVSDLVGAAAPIGLFFGRLANFFNGELWGKATTVPWAMIFPHSDGQPRHPSQLYEATLEGAVLFVLIYFLITRAKALSRPGFIAGVFFAGYGVSRFLVEFVRDSPSHPMGPDHWLTTGMLLSLPMVLFGAFLIYRAFNQPPLSAKAAPNKS